MTVSTEVKGLVEKLFSVGAHYGYTKARRHPTAQKYLFGAKNNTDVFDLEKSVEKLAQAEAAVEKIAATGKQILFVGGKLEARDAVRKAAEAAKMPYVAGRWVGGTLSNFGLIRKRVEKLITLKEDKESGQLSKYTKRERLLIDRDIKRLEETFGGLLPMKALPGALFVVDPRHEKNAVAEARTLGIPVIALANSDCDMGPLAQAIPGNDANIASITFFVNRIADAAGKGAQNAPAKPAHAEKPQTERASTRTRSTSRA